MTDRLVCASRDFLLLEHDHADEWLGTDSYDRRAWAGYLALALLEELNQLDSIPAARLSAWAGAALWFHSVPVGTGDENRKKRLLASVARAAPARLAEMIRLLVRGEVQRARYVPELRAVDPSLDPVLLQTWQSLLSELEGALVSAPTTTWPPEDRCAPIVALPDDQNLRATAIATWELLLERFVRAEPIAGEDVVRKLVERGSGVTTRALATSGVQILLSVSTEPWTRFFPVISQDVELGRSVAGALRVGGPRGAHHRRPKRGRPRVGVSVAI